jgi:regulator of replication initiation timing
MEKIIAESERRKGELEEERRLVRDELKGYLDEQKQLVVCLRQQLDNFNYEKGDKNALETTIARIKTSYRQKGQQVFNLLRGFQLRLKAFQKEQEELNHELKRLVERGEVLRLEDLRQLGATKAGQERRIERELRRQEVERLLARFKEQRQGT